MTSQASRPRTLSVPVGTEDGELFLLLAMHMHPYAPESWTVSATDPMEEGFETWLLEPNPDYKPFGYKLVTLRSVPCEPNKVRSSFLHDGAPELLADESAPFMR